MDGIHDLGGRHGFGAIDVNEKEEQFHEPWEARTRCMIVSMATRPEWHIDWFRHVREMIDPVDYLSRPYFDQWLQSYCAMMIDSGVATLDELKTGKSASTPAGMPEPMRPKEVDPVKLGIRDFERPVSHDPKYQKGDQVVTDTNGVAGHTRLPAYARGRVGVIEDYHGAHIFPDKTAHGIEASDHLYTVSFALGDLFAESSGSKDRVALNLWEPYLERA